MIAVLIFMAAAVAISYWWLWKQKILEQPWLTEGTAVDDRDSINLTGKSAKSGLFVFLAVVTSVFSLFISAYFMRMNLNDWLPVDEPRLLWGNTGVLALGSIAIHWTARAANNDSIATVRYGLIATGIFTSLFILGQWVAWQELVDQGHYLQSNPAATFFFLFTGLHGIHLLGGLWVWLKTTLKVLAGQNAQQTILSVELCRNYWHYLLLVWLVLFVLLLST
ncbi:MAG: cytochrome c oxidase subunit 3 [Gammaproteobacteria bacterium]|nr:cytochrome c oxidase subunit 3 [Gammaproteobacteria bacterium]